MNTLEELLRKRIEIQADKILNKKLKYELKLKEMEEKKFQREEKTKQKAFEREELKKTNELERKNSTLMLATLVSLYKNNSPTKNNNNDNEK